MHEEAAEEETNSGFSLSVRPIVNLGLGTLDESKWL